MSAVLQEIYNELVIEKIDFTERQFSKEYLGKTGSYMAYLKSMKKEASADCLLLLFGKLSRDKQKYEDQMSVIGNNGVNYLIQENIALYDRLRGRVYVDMMRYTH